MSITNAIRRPRFRFGLRTMFLALSAFGLWLGWETNYIHQRHAMRIWIEQHEGEACATWVQDLGDCCWTARWEPTNSLPFWRRWLGDTSVQTIYFAAGTPIAGARRARSLFPEATSIYYYANPMPKGWLPRRQQDCNISAKEISDMISAIDLSE